MENEGFFAEVWTGADWHSDGPVRFRLQACVTCHTEGQQGNRIELAEGVISLDLHKLLDKPLGRTQATVEAGRFVVPFGAFAAQSHPGAFRTVSKPLMYNMGQNVNRDEVGPPLLPMPYSDEGVVTSVNFPIGDAVTATVDGYLVNGLQGSTGGIDFFASRDYTDNNSEPAYGARVTVGTKNVRLGCSYMAGQFNNDAGVGILNHDLDYAIYGIDLTLRHEDLLRIQAEYAAHVSDRFLFLPGKLVDDEEVDGLAVEGELRVLRNPRVSVLVRYDMLSRQGDLPAGTLTITNFDIDRITWGFAVTLPGGTLLLLNHEHWMMPGELDDVDVFGIRWVGTFSN